MSWDTINEVKLSLGYEYEIEIIQTTLLHR